MPNRYICDVLDELRKCHETRNFSVMLGLVEECQTLANRMEAGLYDLKDARDTERVLKELKQEKRALQLDIDEKKLELDDLRFGVRSEKSRKKRGGGEDAILVRKDPIPNPGDGGTV